MERLISKVRAAIDKYNMIEDNDKIAVCLSGGKDSTFLLYALSHIQKFYPKKFSLIAITVDPCFNSANTDFSAITELCDKLNVPYIIKRTELAEIIFNVRKESNPCSLCARMRRGLLHDTAKHEGCNKIALGHHFDDAVETFFMNLFNCGNLSCFSPKSYLSRKDLFMIRPLIFCDEKKITMNVNKLSLPVIKSPCPADGHTNRESTKQLINSLQYDYKDLRKKVIGAMQRANISDWGC